MIDFIELLINSLDQINTKYERNIVIFKKRFGLINGKPKSLNDLGIEFDLSRERIRQIVIKIIQKIQRKGLSQLKKNKIEEPSAKLISFLIELFHDENLIINEITFNLILENLSFMPLNLAEFLLINLVPKSEKINDSFKLLRKKIYEENETIRLKSKYDKRFELIKENIFWLKKISTIDIIKIKKEVKLERTVRFDTSEGICGTFFSEKQNRFIQYESTLELDFLQILEHSEEVIFYQEQPFKIPYTINEKNYIYFPDVFIILKSGKGLVVEIKPRFLMATNFNLIKFRALWRFCCSKGYGLLVTDTRNTGIKSLLNYKINSNFEKEFLDKLNNNTITWSEYKYLKEKYNVTIDEFNSLILKHKLDFRFSPFRIKFSSNL